MVTRICILITNYWAGTQGRLHLTNGHLAYNMIDGQSAHVTGGQPIWSSIEGQSTLMTHWQQSPCGTCLVPAQTLGRESGSTQKLQQSPPPFWVTGCCISYQPCIINQCIASRNSFTNGHVWFWMCWYSLLWKKEQTGTYTHGATAVRDHSAEWVFYAGGGSAALRSVQLAR